MWAINFYLLSPSVLPFSLKEARGEFWEGGATVPHIARIASVWMWFRSKERPRNNEGREWDFWFWPQEKWNKSQNIKQGGGRGEGPYPLPALLLTPFYVWSLTLVPCS